MYIYIRAEVVGSPPLPRLAGTFTNTCTSIAHVHLWSQARLLSVRKGVCKGLCKGVHRGVRQDVNPAG